MDFRRVEQPRGRVPGAHQQAYFRTAEDDALRAPGRQAADDRRERPPGGLGDRPEAQLIEDDAIAALTSKLFPLATVITPNMPETQALCELAVEQGADAIDYENGESISSENDMVTAGHLLAGHFGCAVLVKGGHGTQDASDVLVEPSGKVTWFRARRIDNPNTHGTGCTLSSAIASHLALGETLPEAVNSAKLYLTGALEAQLDLGHGSGPMDHAWKWR